jgi:hypothetical protein
MRRIAWIFTILLGICGSAAEAQSVPKWDVGATAGLVEARPAAPDSPYDNDWYFEGRYAVSVGRFWTDHLKTEIEFATTGEGSRYAQRFANIPGVPPNYPYGVQEYYRLHQTSARIVWQFFDNAWVHPYVFGGVAHEAERQRVRVHEQFYYAGNDPRNPINRFVIAPAADVGPDVAHRAAAIAGAGAKIYMSPSAYINTGFVVSHAKPARNVSFIAGFGVDF